MRLQCRRQLVYFEVGVTSWVGHRWFYFFFFQAEDGIRDLIVTGVQTCALPISVPTIERAANCADPETAKAENATAATGPKPTACARRPKATPSSATAIAIG